jgi:hypothetical protein
MHLLRAQLWNWGTVEGRAAGGAELDRIPSSFHTEPQFVLNKAGWLHAGQKTTQAEGLLREALRARPDDPQLMTALASILLATIDSKTASGDPDATLQPLAEKLARVSQTAVQDHLVAMVHARKGALAIAMAHEKRAISRNPNCVPCLAFLADLQDRRGQLASALTTALLAEGLLHEGARWPELSEKIRSYRAKLAGNRGSAPAP